MELKFNPSKGKNLKFELGIEGIEEELTARLILRHKDGSSIMFESKVKDNTVDLKIPAIKNYKDIESSAILEVVSESQRFVPWNGEIEFELEPSIKIESIEEPSTKKATIKLESKSEVVEENKPEPLKKKDLKSFL